MESYEATLLRSLVKAAESWTRLNLFTLSLILSLLVFGSSVSVLIHFNPNLDETAQKRMYELKSPLLSCRTEIKKYGQPNSNTPEAFEVSPYQICRDNDLVQAAGSLGVISVVGHIVAATMVWRRMWKQASITHLLVFIVSGVALILPLEMSPGTGIADDGNFCMYSELSVTVLPNGLEPRNQNQTVAKPVPNKKPKDFVRGSCASVYVGGLHLFYYGEIEPVKDPRTNRDETLAPGNPILKKKLIFSGRVFLVVTGLATSLSLFFYIICNWFAILKIKHKPFPGDIVIADVSPSSQTKATSVPDISDESSLSYKTIPQM